MLVLVAGLFVFTDASEEDDEEEDDEEEDDDEW